MSQEVNFKAHWQYTMKSIFSFFRWSVKKFSWTYTSCMLIYPFKQPWTQPWNTNTTCKITGQSKPHFLNLQPRLVNEDSNKENLRPCFLGAHHEIGCSVIQFDGACRWSFTRDKVHWLISVPGWALTDQIWNNPPAPLGGRLSSGLAAMF